MNEGDSRSPDPFDRLAGLLEGLPDVTSCKPSTVRTVEPLLGNSQTFVITTYRQKEIGDSIFVEMMDRNGSARFVLPPKVADAIARQRESLTARNRSKAARAAAQERRDRGIVPFEKKQKGGK